jgi:4-amino-4-deoxy-L-arabinose transferase-like glycosyltransferase
MRVTSKRTYAITLFLILLTCYGYFFPKYSNGGSNSRIDLVFAVVDQGVLNIDAYHTNTGDKAFFEGHYYTDKSPGPSLVAIPFYALYKGIIAFPPLQQLLQQPVTNGRVAIFIPAQTWGIRFFTFFSVAVPSALSGVVFFLFASRFTPKLGRAFFLSLIYGLATLIFTYSNILFQHALATFGVFVGFYFLWRVVYENASHKLLWLVGALFGLAVMTDYPVVVLLALMCLWALIEMPNRWALYRVVVGALPFILILAAYHYAIFHTPLPVGYNYSIWGSTVHNQGLLGFVPPTPQSLYGVTFSTFRGLFWISPILLLAFPGLHFMWKDHQDQRSLVVLLATCITVYIIANASYLVWWGGWSVGTRFIVPLIPFLCLPIIFVFNRWLDKPIGRIVIAALSVASFLNVWIQSLAGSDFPPDIATGAPADITVFTAPTWTLEEAAKNNFLSNPLFDYSIPRLLKGEISPNIGDLLHLPPLVNILVLVGIVAIIYIGVPRYLNRREIATQP